LRARRPSVEVSYAAGWLLTEDMIMLSLRPADCILMMSVLVRPCWASAETAAKKAARRRARMAEGRRKVNLQIENHFGPAEGTRQANVSTSKKGPILTPPRARKVELRSQFGGFKRNLVPLNPQYSIYALEW
jgi:hypothetical protein